MIGALLRRNLVHHVRLLTALAAGVAALETLLVVVAARVEAGPGLGRLLEQFVPSAVRNAMLSQFGLISFAGAVSFGFQHPVVLVGTLAFIVVAGTIPAAERESGLLDLILSRPVSRATYLAAVLALLVLGAVLLPLGVLGGAAAGLALEDVHGELPWTRYVPAAASLGMLLLAWGGVTLVFASGSPRRGPVAARVVGIALALYVVELLADLWQPFERIRWVSPFHYFKPVPAALSTGLRAADAAVLLGVCAAGIAVALFRIRRADL